jgi:hypothetical protein
VCVYYCSTYYKAVRVEGKVFGDTVVKVILNKMLLPAAEILGMTSYLHTTVTVYRDHRDSQSMVSGLPIWARHGLGICL